MACQCLAARHALSLFVAFALFSFVACVSRELGLGPKGKEKRKKKGVVGSGVLSSA